MRSYLHLAVLAVALLGACQRDKTTNKQQAGTGTGTAVGTAAGTGAGTGAPGPVVPTTPAKDIDSKDILARTETAPTVDVKHVLIAWKDLAGIYRGRMDPRAQNRSNEDAAKLAQELAAKLKADPGQIDALVKEHSEDPGSQTGEPYTITADSQFVPEFKNLSLRLKEKEVGIVKTMFGYHVIERVPPPPPDPLESNDVLARPVQPGVAKIQHVLISWKDAPAARQGQLDDRAKNRTKADADKLAQEILAKAKAGDDFAKLMKQYSEDPGSKDNARIYDVGPDTPMVEPFKKMALRLGLGEVGMVKSIFGWHVMKRVPPPPPDALESADILKREPVTQQAKVKHILLGYTEVNAGDPRGQKRTRAELEGLIKKTVAALKKGGKIEPLMKELSEDPGSAESGTSYDASPDAGLVQPFKDLSLRLNVGEVGVVKTDFGFHIIQRVE